MVERIRQKRKLSVEALALHALSTGRYESFLVAAFLFDNRDLWFTRAEQFAKLCKEEENKTSVPEYDLVASEKLLPDSIQIIRRLLRDSFQKLLKF